MSPARADRCLTHGLGLLLGLALLAASAATLAGCEDPPDSAVMSPAGWWQRVEPYPGAPSGTVCWAWRDGVGESKLGGPHCVEPNPPVCTAGPVDGGAR